MKLKNFCVVVAFVIMGLSMLAQGAEMGSCDYEDFDNPRKSCKMCHKEIYQEWAQSMMAKSFTHKWDEVEYFKLALPHAQSLEKVAGVKAGCIGCHAPLAFLAGDIPPKPPAAKTRANEGVSCDVCHSITGSTEEDPFNFSFIIKPGGPKIGSRKDSKSPMHAIKRSDFLNSPKLCATCHDEQSPYGAWVKSTYREWKAGPYAKEGVRCQDCHMQRAPGKSATGGKTRPDIAHHTFHGAHSRSKLAGSVDVAMYAGAPAASPGDSVDLRVVLFNGKVGHYIPSGSSEERMLWLEVWADLGDGKKIHLPVKPKGIKGEAYLIADSKAITYQAMGEIMKKADYKGLKRDGNVPDGARIFRRPFFDPKGRMTICQWYTAENEKIDYRIGPRESKVENYTFTMPENLKKKTVRITAKLFYSQVPTSVGEFLELPKSEYASILVNQSSVMLKVKK